MKVYRTSLALALLLSSIPSTSFSQPSILSVKLSGLPQTIYDTLHPYTGLSASPGADVFLTVTASGPGPLGYQWRFSQRDLRGETGTSLEFTNLDLTNAGDYTVVVTNSSGSVTSQVARLTVDSTFTKISTGPVVTDPAFSEGGAWADYDNDGFPDLFVVSGQGIALLPFLYRNNGNGTFTKITTGAPVNVAADATSASWGDYENNGNLDLFVATSGNHLLYHNSGDSTFTRILTGPVVTDTANSLGSTWVDYDQDGLLDLFVTVLDANANAHNLLYRNNGDGIFTAMNYGPLVTDVGSAIGCGFADYDNDGHPDLFVCGGRGPGTPAAPNRLYHNNGNGNFTRINTGAIATDAEIADPAMQALGQCVLPQAFSSLTPTA